MILPLRRAQNLNSAKAIFEKLPGENSITGFRIKVLSLCNVYYMT